MNKQFIRGTTLIFIGLFLSKILGMANNIFLARYLHAHDFGIFLLGISIIEFLRSPLTLGTPSIIPKFVAEYKEKKQDNKVQDILSLSLGICCTLTILFSIITYSSAETISLKLFNEPELENLLKLFSFVLPVIVIFPILLSIYRGYEITKARLFFENLLLVILRILIFAILLVFGYKLKAASLSYVFAYVIVLLLVFAHLKKTLNKNIRFKLYDNELSSPLFKLAWPLMFQSMIWIIYSKIDRIFIGIYLSSDQVGIYGAAISIAAILSMIPQSFSFLSLPIFSKMLVNNSTKIYAYYKELTFIIFTIALPIFICLIIFSKEILIILYGSEYSTGAIPLMLISGGVFSMCMVGPAADALVAAGKTKAPLVSLFVGCLVNIILNILLIPMYGINGAALSTFISMITTRFILAIFNYYCLKISTLQFGFLLWSTMCISMLPIILVIKNIYSQYIIYNTLIACTIYLFIIYIILGLIYTSKYGKKFMI